MLNLEALETRTLLSNVTVSFPTPSSPLTITGDSFNDNFTITENTAPGPLFGTVTVAPGATRVIPGAVVVAPSTIDGTSAPFTTDSAVASIIVVLPGTANFDFITLTGQDKTTPGTVKNVTMTATGANLTFAANGVDNSGSFVLSDTNSPGIIDAALTVNVDNSSFATLSISQTGGAPASVELGNDSISASVSVSEGNGDDDSITLDNGNIFGTTTLVQGAGGPTTHVGNSDAVSVSNSSVRNLLIQQLLDGANNQITVNALGVASINPAGLLGGVTTSQGNGAGNSTTITGATTPTPLNINIALPPGFSPSNIVVGQGGGSGDSASVTSSTVPGNISISEQDVAGNLTPDSALISGDNVGYTQGSPVLAGFAGNLTITQGNALDTATVNGSTAVGNVSISQGNGGGTSTSPSGDQATITDVTAGVVLSSGIYGGNLTIIQGTGSGDSAAVSGSSAVGNLSITQADVAANPFGDSSTVFDDAVGGNVTIAQSNASGNTVAADLTTVGGNVTITQNDVAGNPLGDAATVVVTTVGGNISVAQGNANSDAGTVDVETIGGDVLINQGSGSGNSATMSGSSAVVNVSIAQASGNGDSASISGVTAAGNITITQSDVASNAIGDTANLIDVTAGSTDSNGLAVNGTATITQGNAPGDVALLNGDAFNNVAITQGDNVQAPDSGVVDSDVAEINGTSVSNNISIIQGTGTITAADAGLYVTAIGFDYLGLISGDQASGSVTVGGDTYIYQHYANNQIFLGDSGSGSVEFTTTFLDAYTGAGGGAYVQVSNTVVADGTLGIFSPYCINGAGEITSVLDNASSLTATVNPVITPVLAWANPADITYGTALDATELDATTTVEGTFLYSQPAGTVLSAGAGQTLSVTFTPTDTVDYSSVTATVTINVDRATPLLAWANPADITYGTALGAAQLDATTTVPGTFVYSQPAGTVLSAGAGQELSVTFTPTDTTDYTSVAATVTINVNKAVLTVTAADVSMTYGSSVPALTYTITGFVNGDDADVVSGTPGLSTTASSSSPPGSYPINVDVSGLSAANYSFAAPDPTLTIERVTPTITWANPADVTYGTALGAAQLDATTTVPGTFLYSQPAGTVLSAGAGQVLSVTFTPTDTVDYSSVTATVTINVDRATPLLAWANPADITYGTAPGATQLDATTTVPGSFVYTPAAGTVLSAGAGQTLSVTFTPTDTSDYNSVTTTATINVLRAQLSVVAADKSMNYGSSVSALTDTITGFVNGDQAGVVSGSPGLSTSASGASHPGSYAINVNVSGLSATNYSFAAKNGTLTIGRATPTITWAKPTDITYGTALGATQLDATTTVPGSFVYTPAAGTVLSAGAGQTLSVTFTPTDTSDYNSVTTTATINVLRVQLSVVAADKSMNYGSSVSALTDTITGFVNGDQAGVVSGSPGLSTSASGASHPGSYAINVNVSGLSATNYSFAAKNGTLTIGRATPTITWAKPTDITYGTALGATQLDATTTVPGSFVYTPAAGTVLSAGAGQTLSVTFTPTDTSDYNSVTITATINVSRAQLTVAAADKSMTYGSSVPALTDTITGFVNGDQAGVISGTPGLSTSASGASNPGSYAINVNVSGLSATNYSFAAQSGTLTIGAAPPPTNPVVLGSIAFVTSLYRDLLLTSPGPADTTYWVNQLDAGTSPLVVASAINRSPERRAILGSHHRVGISFAVALRRALAARQNAIRIALRAHRFGRH